MRTLEKLDQSFSQVGKTTQKFSNATKEITHQTEQFAQKAQAAKKHGKSFLSSIGRIATYRLIRSAIRAVTEAVREGAQNFYEYSKAVGAPFAAAMDKAKSASLIMKNQLGSAFGELYQIVHPVIMDLVADITQLASWLSMLFAALSGKGGWYKAKDGIDAVAESASGAGQAAKEALRYLAPFDELNRLPADTPGGGGGGSSNQQSFNDMFDWTEFEENSAWGKISAFVQENLEAIKLIVDGFLFAIGVAVLLSGNVPLGLGLMAAGAVGAYKEITDNWDKIKTQMQGPLGEISALVGGSLLAIGAILAFSGASIPIGVGLMLAGAATLAPSVAANWDIIKQKLENPVARVVALVGGASLMLGVLALVGGNIPLGVGLIVAGSAGLAASVTADWNKVIDFFKDGWTLVKAWFEDVVVRGMKQLAIDAVNGFFQTFIDPITEYNFGQLPKDVQDQYKEMFGDIHFKLIPDLDPPPGTFYAQTKKKIEENSKKSPTGVNSTAILNKPKNNLTGKNQPTVNSIANFVKPRYNLTNEQLTFKSYADFKGRYNHLSAEQRTFVSAADFQGRKNNLTAAQRTFTSVANMANTQNSLTTRQTTFGSTANINSYLDNIAPVFNSLANIVQTEIDRRIRNRNGNVTLNATANIVATTGQNRLIMTTQAGGGVFRNGGWNPIQSFAGGGSPFGGQIFRARENGNPELVGTLRGSTAVMNNDQIVASVSSGVARAIAGIRFQLAGMNDGGGLENALYNAMLRALNDSDGDVYLDGDVLYRKMVSRNRQETYRMGSNPMTAY